MPLHRREEALGVAAEQIGEGGETGREAAERRPGPDRRNRSSSHSSGPQRRTASARSAAGTSPIPRRGASALEPALGEGGEATGRGDHRHPRTGPHAATARPSATRYGSPARARTRRRARAGRRPPPRRGSRPRRQRERPHGSSRCHRGQGRAGSGAPAPRAGAPPSPGPPVVLHDQPCARLPRPQLEAGLQLSALGRVPPGQRDRRAEISRAIGARRDSPRPSCLGATATSAATVGVSSSCTASKPPSRSRQAAAFSGVPLPLARRQRRVVDVMLVGVILDEAVDRVWLGVGVVDLHERLPLVRVGVLREDHLDRIRLGRRRSRCTPRDRWSSSARTRRCGRPGRRRRQDGL